MPGALNQQGLPEQLSRMAGVRDSRVPLASKLRGDVPVTGEGVLQGISAWRSGRRGDGVLDALER